MLNHPMLWDIREERPAEKADICSWMYIKKVSEDQCPCLRIVSRGTPLRCMAMAPPAPREWLLMLEGGKPFLSRPVATTAALSILLMSPDCRHRQALGLGGVVRADNVIR